LVDTIPISINLALDGISITLVLFLLLSVAIFLPLTRTCISVFSEILSAEIVIFSPFSIIEVSSNQAPFEDFLDLNCIDLLAGYFIFDTPLSKSHTPSLKSGNKDFSIGGTVY